MWFTNKESTSAVARKTDDTYDSFSTAVLLGMMNVVRLQGPKYSHKGPQGINKYLAQTMVAADVLRQEGDGWYPLFRRILRHR